MKIHYTNILLFPLKLNILVNTHKKPHTTARHTQKIPTTRSLSECELYAPVNYYSDPQMKEVMDNFNKQTQQRFHEYDERMKTTRQKCKEKCDKEIQKIILKDKLEKELTEKFATLQTDIQSDAIPTCVCEKSVTDKVEKGCLRCGSVLGGGVMPGFGAIGGTALYALNQLKPTAIAAATEYALAEGAAKGAVAGEAAGKSAIIGALREYFKIHRLNGTSLQSFFKTTPYNDVTTIATAIDTDMTTLCDAFLEKFVNQAFCDVRIRLNIVANPGKPMVQQKTAITEGVNQLVRKAKGAADLISNEVSSATSSKIITKQTALIEAGFNSSTTSIYASIIVILIIVLIMVIIYLILRYRRKKKLKKKLQYIKLLEE
ncbi:hypothetical protein PFBG_00241 [Plasmodium falciparum 7G8]|uniref:Rifin n=1 Tax=Plasmodium falciparum (isolate 7G8) TaxID=57266 RepID=W7FM46_PLAF8|nr:hypothetical protein PFBG_00241 [Plasmodium falciparum 7G8]